MIRRMRLRARLLVALVIPIFVLAIGGVMVGVSAQRDIEAARQVERLAGVGPWLIDVVSAFSEESAAAVALLTANGTREEFEQAMGRTDETIASMHVEVGKLGADKMPGQFNDRLQQVFVTGAETRQSIRDAVSSGILSAGEAQVAYLRLSSGTAALPEALGSEIPDRHLANFLGAYTTSVRYMAASGAADSASRLSPPETAAQLQGLASTEVALTKDDLEQRLAVLDISTGQDESPELIARSLTKAITAESVTRAETIRNGRLLLVGAMVLAITLSVLVVALISRTVVKPIERLRQAAVATSQDLERRVQAASRNGVIEPPARLVIHGSDEVAELGDAFNDAAATAIRVAGEQAALRAQMVGVIVSIARRDSALVQRQLVLLDQYEQNETDPVVLSHLFALDHLATRQRRNTNSLLVVAGERRADNVRQVLSLTDVLRSAASEIEQFARVRLALQVDPVFNSSVTGSAIHMFSELLDNATRFSPPDTPVNVLADQHERGVQVVIEDWGIGANEAQLRELNELVASGASLEMPHMDKLGLQVVARLRERLGAEVRLGHADHGAGLRVEVLLPKRTILSGLDGPVIHPENLNSSREVVSHGRTVSLVDPGAMSLTAPIREAVRIFGGYVDQPMAER